MTPMNIKELKEVVISMWNPNITLNFFKKLSAYMPRRLQLWWTARAI